MRGFRLVAAADLSADNPIEHDLFLDGGRLDTVDDDEATAQEIKTRLLFFKGENFADLREGVPYFQEILRKGVDDNRVRAIVRRVLQSVPSVVDVISITISRDRARRTATVYWTVRTNTGRVINSQDFGPLIVPEETKLP